MEKFCIDFRPFEMSLDQIHIAPYMLHEYKKNCHSATEASRSIHLVNGNEALHVSTFHRWFSQLGPGNLSS